MTDCVVEFHLEVLGLMDLVQGALRRFYPRKISQVDMVSGDVTDVVTFSMVAYLDYFTEAVDSECLFFHQNAVCSRGHPVVVDELACVSW